jgi:hypothetical protein
MPTDSPVTPESSASGPSKDDAQAWQQSSFDLRQGLDVIELGPTTLDESTAVKPNGLPASEP